MSSSCPPTVACVGNLTRSTHGDPHVYVRLPEGYVLSGLANRSRKQGPHAHTGPHTKQFHTSFSPTRPFRPPSPSNWPDGRRFTVWRLLWFRSSCGWSLSVSGVGRCFFEVGEALLPRTVHPCWGYGNDVSSRLMIF